MIQRTTILAPAIARNRQLTLEELESLKLPLIFQGDTVAFNKSLNGYRLRKPLTIELRKILAAREKGLVDYVIRSCLNDRATLIPFIFDNETVLKVARHFLRHCSGSYKSCMLY